MVFVQNIKFLENVIAIGINGNPMVQCRASMVGEAVPPTPIH